MVTIIAIDKEGKIKKGSERKVPIPQWEHLQRFGKLLRWKLVKEKKEVKPIIKEEKDGREKRSGTGNAVKKAK